jgi:hypothetical protein
MKQFTVHSLQFTKVAIIIALMTVLAISGAHARVSFEANTEYEWHDYSDYDSSFTITTGADYATFQVTGVGSGWGDGDIHVGHVFYFGLGLEPGGWSGYQSNPSPANEFEVEAPYFWHPDPGTTDTDWEDAVFAGGGYYAYTSVSEAESFNEHQAYIPDTGSTYYGWFEGSAAPPVPELPPFAGQALTLLFGGARGWRRRKARGERK